MGQQNLHEKQVKTIPTVKNGGAENINALMYNKEHKAAIHFRGIFLFQKKAT